MNRTTRSTLALLLALCLMMGRFRRLYQQVLRRNGKQCRKYFDKHGSGSC